MKIVCSSWSYNQSFEEERITPREWIEKCADELEIDGIELLDLHFQSETDEEIKEVKNLAARKGLTISCISISNDFGTKEKEERRKRVEKVKKWIDIAYKFGAPVLRVFSGWMGAPPWDPEGDYEELSKDEIWQTMIEDLKECVKKAEELGVFLAVENHNSGGITSTPEDMMKLVKEINSDWIGINLDLGGYYGGPVEGYKSPNNYEAVEKTIDLAPHIHAKFQGIDDKGRDTKFDYEKIFEILKRQKYNGFVSIEYEGQEDDFTAVPKIVGYLKSLFREYEI